MKNRIIGAIVGAVFGIAAIMPASAMGVFPWWPSNAQIIAATQTACSFVPTAESITALFATGNSAFASAESIASIICSAVTSTATASAAAPGQVISKTITFNGQKVVIKGSFVQK
jgi:hypothetical protein